MKSFITILNSFASILVFTLCFNLSAQEIPVRTDGNSEVTVITKGRVYMALRNQAIAKAHYSIQMLNWDHGADDVGLRIVQALRTAIARGVKVQYAYESAISGLTTFSDMYRQVPKLLMDPRLFYRHPETRPEIITGLVHEKLKAGLAASDFIHEKLLIVDAGTPYASVFIGGFGASDYSVKLLDSGLMIRPVDARKNFVGDDAHVFFDRLWAVLNKVYTREPVAASTYGLINMGYRVDDMNGYVFDKSEMSLYSTLVSALTNPNVAETPMLPFQFRPKSIQVVGNSLMENLVNKKRKSTFFLKEDSGSNPITQKLSALIAKAKSIELTSYSFAPPAELRAALLSFLNAGGDFKIFTNGRKAHAQFFMPLVPYLRGLPVDYTYENYLELMRAAKEKSSQVGLFLFDDDKAARPGANRDIPSESTAVAPIYVHRKSMLIDNILVEGSYNFTQSSNMKNDEVALVMEDARMADFMRRKNRDEADRYYIKTDYESAKKDFLRTHWLDKEAMPFIKTFY